MILSTGARWRPMNVPGEAEYRNRGVAYCPHCDGPLFKGKRVAVIGGGNSGVEAAIDLAGLAAHVTLIEFDPGLRADEVLRAKLRSLANVSVLTSAQTTEVFGDGTKVVGLAYKDRTTGAPRRLDLDGIFVQIGLVPNTEWLKGAVKLTGRGEIEVDSRGETSRLWRVRRRRRDDHAVQADRHRHGRRRDGRPLRLRLPDARAGAPGRGGVGAGKSAQTSGSAAIWPTIDRS